jgi:hypothetical protein
MNIELYIFILHGEMVRGMGDLEILKIENIF